jgi:putative chitinase
MTMVDYLVTAGKLNFRSAPAINGTNIIATLPRGHMLHGEGGTPGAEWLKVTAFVPGRAEEDGPAVPQAQVQATAVQAAAGAPAITLAQLKDLAPTGKDQFMEPLAQNCVAVRQQYGLAVTPLHLCHFLAQLAHECAGFRTMRELWGPTKAQRGYEGRKDLGNLQPGDGRRFMGRGYIQITGRANYAAYGSKLGLALTANPTLAEDPITALNIACLYWEKRGIDFPAGNNDIEAVTRKINGGTNGLPDRKALFRKARKLWP